MKTTFQAVRPQNFLLLLLGVILVFGINGCKKQEGKSKKSDDKTKTTQQSAMRDFSSQKFQATTPYPGKTQQIQGVVSKIGEDGRSVWLKIDERKNYAILSERLSGSNRDGSNNSIRIQLSYVSPLGSVTQGPDFKKKWKDYVLSTLKAQLLNKTVLLETEYLPSAKMFVGSIFLYIRSKEGDQFRDINLWMVSQGLSFYFIDQGKSPEDNEYIDAQRLAQKNKKGLWKYE